MQQKPRHTYYTETQEGKKKEAWGAKGSGKNWTGKNFLPANWAECRKVSGIPVCEDERERL